jgi:ring-1,2-phenylacetyl-CoA epoxidase subunit PaaE
LSRFHTIPVSNIEKTTADCAVISFAISDDLKTTFAYRQGQYLTIKANIDGEEVRRSYSLCSSPLDNEWSIAVKKIEYGKFSSFANDTLKVGDKLELMPPNGRFFVEIAPTASKNYVAFAAGSGITPILSILKTHLALEPNSTFRLFYINQAVSTIILKEEIEALKNIYLNRLEIFHFLTKQQRDIPFFNGRMDEEKLNIIFEKMIDLEDINDFFICGPNEMIFKIRDFLIEKGVSKSQVHFELFSTTGMVAQKKATAVDASILTEIVVTEGGKNYSFSIPQGSENILDAALNNYADLPFACKGGVCCTCKAKLIEGTVEMQVNYGLEQEEIDEGYILTCQAIGTSKRVVVDFDA